MKTILKEARVFSQAYGFTSFRDLQKNIIIVSKQNLRKFQLLKDEIVDIDYDLIEMVDGKVAHIKVTKINNKEYIIKSNL
jgi:hypothetical protein